MTDPRSRVVLAPMAGGPTTVELVAAAAEAGHPLTLRIQPGYDHSYYFIASFIGDHVAHHAAALLGHHGGCEADGCCGGH